MKKRFCIFRGFLILSTLLMLPDCMTVSDTQPIVQLTHPIMLSGNRRIAVLPVKAQTSLAPDSVLALRTELNKRIGPALNSKLPSSIVTDVSVVADQLSQTGNLAIFEQLVSTYENTGVIDKGKSTMLGQSLMCDYLLLSRLKAEKVDLGIVSRGMGASLEIILISANTGEEAWGGSGEWKRGGIFGAGKTSPGEVAENLLTLAFDSLQSGADHSVQEDTNKGPVVEKSEAYPVQEETNKGKAFEGVGVMDRRDDKKLVAEIQKRLQKLGYTPGSVDGIMGKKTIGALKEFQQDNNLSTTGKADRKTMHMLRMLTKDSGDKPTGPSSQTAEAPQPDRPSPETPEAPPPDRPSPETPEAPQPDRPSPKTPEAPEKSSPGKVRSPLDL